MSQILPEFFEIETGPNPQFSIIWLHGLGADGRDFADLPQMLNLTTDSAVRYVFPHAPLRPITLNGGMVMRGWYDLTGLEATHQEDTVGLEQSSTLVTCLIEQECVRGILPSHVFLGGFSQGGALALHLGLRYAERLGGIVGLSTYLPVSDRVLDERSDANRPTAIFMAHGLYDSVVGLPLGEASRRALEELEYDMTWRTYPIQHSVSELEMSDLSIWISEHMTESVVKEC